MSKKDRVIGLEKIAVGELEPHPLNYRVHKSKQTSLMEEMLENIGMAGALLVYKHDGHYRIIDGHLRASLYKKTDKVPCLLLDITDEEANTILATYDNITGMADLDSEKFSKLTELFGDKQGEVGEWLSDIKTMSDNWDTYHVEVMGDGSQSSDKTIKDDAPTDAVPATIVRVECPVDEVNELTELISQHKTARIL